MVISGPSASALLAACLLLLSQAGLAEFVGTGTAYSAPFNGDAAGLNACQFDKLETEYFERFYAALPSSQFRMGKCGECVRVRGLEAGASSKSFVVMVVDECTSCSRGSLQLSPEAMEAVTGFSWESKQVAWEWAESCAEPSTAAATAQEAALLAVQVEAAAPAAVAAGEEQAAAAPAPAEAGSVQPKEQPAAGPAAAAVGKPVGSRKLLR